MTRTFNGLYPRIYDMDNLWLAWRRARLGGKRKWPSVADFEIDLEQNLYALHEELRTRPGRGRTATSPSLVRRSGAFPRRPFATGSFTMR